LFTVAGKVLQCVQAALALAVFGLNVAFEHATHLARTVISHPLAPVWATFTDAVPVVNGVFVAVRVPRVMTVAVCASVGVEDVLTDHPVNRWPARWNVLVAPLFRVQVVLLLPVNAQEINSASPFLVPPFIL
jgi:hypothetical protein